LCGGGSKRTVAARWARPRRISRPIETALPAPRERAAEQGVEGGAGGVATLILRSQQRPNSVLASCRKVRLAELLPRLLVRPPRGVRGRGRAVSAMLLAAS